ncbi:NB-ARC domain-containing protein [Actinokineospora sp. NBRC 105648]|uniref:NB-ARC domain-containing protein n=1 Tax=Actinokineospora sp. NBRC 105648 TaxID=3032206 RepID=UPI0024A38EC0|nr:NB-ARC domain-containing protein [Actinokineospora sp. NBRC 105648]GLZ41945.1 hypothetical protein Acsp05_55690 [Actinokineospora sp. NBRC 105648]
MSDVSNVLGGHAHSVVQANNITGDVHFHAPVPAARVPRMVPPASRHFTNQVCALDEADRHWRAAPDDRPLVLVVVGLPGVGKTEVARRWLRDHAEEFPDGLFGADLSAGVRENGLESTVLREFLLAVGREPGAIPDTAASRALAFGEWSADKRVAVLVDDALTASQVRMLMPRGGRSVVVVTVPARLVGLGVREVVAEIELTPLEDSAARELLGRIATADRVRAEPAAVAELIAFCAGLPIALCVVGATLAAYPHRPIARLVREVRDRREGLAPLSRTADASVAAVFDSASERLGDTARRCYQLLGVHPGPGDVHVDTVAAVLGLAEWDARDAVDELLATGLAQEGRGERLSLHDLVRLHALSKAEQDGVAARLLAAVDDFYHRVGVAAGHAVMPGRPWRDLLAPHLAAFDDQVPEDAAAWLAAERVNLLTTVRRAAESAHPARAWELALLLWPVHERGKYLDDLATASALGAEAAHREGLVGVEAVLRTQEGFAALHGGDPDTAYALFSTAVDLAADLPAALATAVESLGLAALALGRPDAAELLRRNVDLATATGDERRIALARMHLAKAVEPAEAVRLLTAARERFVDGTGDAHNVAKCDLLLGVALTSAGEYERASACLSAAHRLTRELARPFDEAHALTAVGDLAAARGEVTAAVEEYRRALVVAESFGYEPRARELRARLSSLGHDPEGDVEAGRSTVD